MNFLMLAVRISKIKPSKREQHSTLNCSRVKIFSLTKSSRMSVVCQDWKRCRPTSTRWKCCSDI